MASRQGYPLKPNSIDKPCKFYNVDPDINVCIYKNKCPYMHAPTVQQLVQPQQSLPAQSRLHAYKNYGITASGSSGSDRGTPRVPMASIPQRKRSTIFYNAMNTINNNADAQVPENASTTNGANSFANEIENSFKLNATKDGFQPFDVDIDM